MVFVGATDVRYGQGEASLRRNDFSLRWLPSWRKGFILFNGVTVVVHRRPLSKWMPPFRLICCDPFWGKKNENRPRCFGCFISFYNNNNNNNNNKKQQTNDGLREVRHWSGAVADWSLVDELRDGRHIASGRPKKKDTKVRTGKRIDYYDSDRFNSLLLSIFHRISRSDVEENPIKLGKTQ